MTRAPRRLLAGLALWLVSVPAVAIELRFTRVADLGDVVDIRNAGDGSARLFLVGQGGQVRIMRDGALLGQPFLDLSGQLSTTGNEQGLLSLAFAPDYARSGHFYTWYTNLAGHTVLSRFSVSEQNPDRARMNSETILLTVAQPRSNHNGGRLQFGLDGYLYLGLGDGGGAGDPDGNGQAMDTLLGKLIRIDVSGGGSAYAIPPGNPFAGNDGVPGEIWASGLRNPWRISIDRRTGDLFIADVGQNSTEEVNVQAVGSGGGENYGWNLMEGSSCFQAGCDPTGLVTPVSEYDHGQGCSVTGGEVYRGNAYPDLHGRYLFGDFCSGAIWSLRRVNGQWQTENLAATSLSIATFGLGGDGSLYVASRDDGVYRVSDGPVVAEQPFRINGGLNDSWFEAATAGQGVTVTVYEQAGVMFLSWFTYELERPEPGVAAQLGDAGHRWLTAQGGWQGDTAELVLFQSLGGVFDSADPAPAAAEPIGSVTIRFHDCASASLHYRIPSLGRTGRIELRRLAPDNIATCEALAGM